MALVVQNTGQRQGNPNPVLYQLGNGQYFGGGVKIFNDVLVGDNFVLSTPAVQSFSCKTGFDQVTGLGSVNAYALVQNWPSAGATLSASPNSGVAPFTTELTAQFIGQGFGTVNYTFWWDCPFTISTVQQGIQLCNDPSDPTIGAKSDNRAELSAIAIPTYASAKTYSPLVVIERNNGAFVATTKVVVSSAASCSSFTVSPLSVSSDAQAGSRQVAVVGIPAGCHGGSWTASGNGSWLTVSPTDGSGSGTVTVFWAANGAASSRSGSATVAGTGFVVTQAGTTATAPPAPYLLSPGSSVSPGTTTAMLSPLFFWLTVSSADSYQLELSDAATVYPIQTIPASQSTIVLSNPLVDNHAYKWRMRSHGAAGWGAYGVYYYFSTYTGSTTGDFAISASPSSGAVSPGASAAFVLNTTTIQGSAQTLTFSVGSLPSGVTPSFSLSSVQSGSQTTLTMSVGTGTTPSTYAIAVSATNNVQVTHAVTLGLTVNPPPTTGEPAICLTPSSLGFSDQMVGTSSPVQLVTLRNCGNGSLHISSLGASPEFFIGAGSIVPPVDLPAGTATTFQVGFAPLGSGPRTGSARVFSNAAGSHTDLPTSGTGTPAPLTTGTINVQATLNGQPFSGFTVFSLTGPGGTINFGNVPLNRPDQGMGAYTVGFVGSAPGGGTLTSITPSSTQTLSAGGNILFTFNFTAPNEFAFSCPTSTFTGTTALMVTQAGGSASVPLLASYILGGAQTMTLAVAGLPPGATASFNPQPLVLASGQATSSSTFSVTTGPTTPPGLYQLTFSATNQDGTTHSLTGTLAVVTDVGLQLVSSGAGSILADGFNDLPSVSADGRYVAFVSLATNLVAGDTNGTGDVFVRDRQTGTTVRASVAESGAQGDDFSGWPSISADGRFVAFQSFAGNLIPTGRRGFADIYVRDLQLGHTTRVSLSSAGVPADGDCRYPSMSGDGRFVAFTSNASNLVPGGGGGVNQVYVRDLLTGQTSLASAANDGSIGDAYSWVPTISGDGRYVAFFSTASNFIPGAVASGQQIFLRDLRAGTIQLASGAPDGSPPNASSPFYNGSERIAVSPDGRYVAFASVASNLISGDTNFASDIFVWDRITKATTVASVTNDGTLLFGAHAPTMSADGRFVAFCLGIAGGPAPQTGVHDFTTGRTVIYSVGPGSVLGSAFCADSAFSANGRVLAFASSAPNLIAGDTNGQQDIFAVVLPTSGSVFAQTLTVSPASIPGGGAATGTITLSAPAPAGGATVSLSSSDPQAQVPPVVTVPAGSNSASFSIPTLLITAELPVSMTASYGGGSPWALLVLEKASPARIDVLQGNGQITAAGAMLPIPFSARVLDSANNPAFNVVVQFSAPTTGPSGFFSGGATSALVATDASGVATAPAFTANNLSGQYVVLASVAGINSPAVFNLMSRTGFYYTVRPCRVVDTRNPTSPYGGPALGANTNRTFNLAGLCGVPATAQAVAANVTVTASTQGGDLRVFPGDAPLPVASVINFSGGQTRTNNAVFPLSKDGNASFAFHNDMGGGTVQVIVDIMGYFQ
jgi:hypothetical protein